MALIQNTSIVTSNLVMYYDVDNTKKSFLGEPTTNLLTYPYASWNGSGFVSSSYPGYDPTGTSKRTYVPGVDNPVGAPGVMEYSVGSTGYKYWSVDAAIPSAGTYTFSYYARLVGTPTASSNLGLNQLWRANGVDQGVTGDWNPTYTTSWRRYSTTGPVSAAGTLAYFPIHSSSLTGGYTIQYCGFQCEAGSYAKPFVVGTRSNTQAVKDMSGNSTLTASALTYSTSGGRFTYNGSGNYIDCGTGGALTLGNNGAFTVGAWINCASLKNFAGIVSKVISNRSGTYSFMACMHNDGTLAFYNNTSWYYSTNVGLTTNTWYYVNFVYNGAGTLSYYVNGNSAGTSSLTWPETTAHNVFVGSWYSVNTIYDFNGTIAIAQLYNRALTAAEVKQNYDAIKRRFGLS